MLYLSRGKDQNKEQEIKWEIADHEGLSEYFNKDNLQIEGLNLDIDTSVLFIWIESRGIGVHAFAVNYNRTG